MLKSRLTAFGYRDYRLFWLGGAFSNLGMWALISGRLWLMHTMTGSAFMAGLVTLSGLGPILLLSMWGGVFADRVNRLKLLTRTRAMFAALAFITGILIVTDVIRPWQLIAISLSTGILLSFDIPSRQALLPNLVRREDLANAVAVYSLLFGGAAIIGPSFFAPLVNLWGLEGLFFLIGIAYALTVVMLLMMKPVERVTEPFTGKIWEGLLEGLVYVQRHRVILSLIGMGIVAGIFAMPFHTLLPVFTDHVLEGGVESYSYLLLSAGIGGLTGTVILALMVGPRNQGRYLLISGVGFGLGILIFSRTSWLPASVPLLGLVGGFAAMFQTIDNILVQSLVDEEFRGRVMSIHQITWGTTAIGGIFMGFLAHTVDAPFALTLGGLVTTSAIGIMALRIVRWLSSTPSPRSSAPV